MQHDSSFLNPAKQLVSHRNSVCDAWRIGDTTLLPAPAQTIRRCPDTNVEYIAGPSWNGWQLPSPQVEADTFLSSKESTHFRLCQQYVKVISRPCINKHHNRALWCPTGSDNTPTPLLTARRCTTRDSGDSRITVTISHIDSTYNSALLSRLGAKCAPGMVCLSRQSSSCRWQIT